MLEHTHCIFCGKTEIEPTVVIQENGFQARQCPICHLIFVSPRPAEQEITNLYEHDHADRFALSYVSDWYTNRLVARHHLATIKKYVQKYSLLELGSGAGYFLHEAQKQGFAVHGIEINPIECNFIRNTLQLPCQSVRLAQAYPEKIFDIIYHRDVLSHLADPLAEFKEMHKRLAHGGCLVFETGDLGEADQSTYKVFSRFQLPDHLFFFSRINIARLLAATGFKAVKIYTFSIYEYLAVLKLIDKIRRMKKQLLRRAVSSHALPSSSEVTVSPDRLKIFTTLKNFIRYTLHYFLRYKAGRLLSCSSKPRTMLVIAHKV